MIIKFPVDSDEDRILIKQLRLRLEKGIGAKAFLRDFPNKNWKLATLKRYEKFQDFKAGMRKAWKELTRATINRVN